MLVYVCLFLSLSLSLSLFGSVRWSSIRKFLSVCVVELEKSSGGHKERERSHHGESTEIQ